MQLVTGNTYPVSGELRALGGGRWDPEQKGWMFPDEKAAKARQIVAGAPIPQGKRRTGKTTPRPLPAEKYSGGRQTTKTDGLSHGEYQATAEDLPTWDDLAAGDGVSRATSNGVSVALMIAALRAGVAAAIAVLEGQR